VSEPVVSVDCSEVREGKLEELKTAIKELVGFVGGERTAAIAYNVYFSDDGTQMTVLQVHPNSGSMEFHMEVAGPAFPKLMEFIKLSTIDIYGRPSDKLLEQMRRKAQMLGTATVAVHELHAGFTRLSAH